MYTPGQAAQQLDIDPSTLRRWAQLVAPLLSPGARTAHPTRRGSARSYSDDDMAVLREVQSLLNTGMGLADIRARLVPGVRTAGTDQAPGAQEVISVEQPAPQPEVARDLARLRTLLAAHEELIKSQQQHIADLQLRADQARDDMREAREHLQAERATWIDQREQMSNEVARLSTQLNQARQDEAATLDSLRATLARIPLWLRSLLGLGV